MERYWFMYGDDDIFEPSDFYWAAGITAAGAFTMLSLFALLLIL
jgi:hypothetical protein